MISFVQYATRSKIAHIKLEVLAVYVLRPRDDAHFAFYHLKKPWKRQTALFAYLLALDRDDLGVYEHMPLARSRLGFGRVHHKKPL